MNTTSVAIAAALPFALIPIATVLRVRTSKHLDDELADAPADAPLVSVVVPARNEALNIERCIKSILSTTYPRVEVIVVDDHSTDATAAIVRELARGEERLRLVQNEPLPPGWFGKQWACDNGARRSHGDLILFADADTFHSPDLITRSVNAITRRNADLFSVAGRQEIVSFWEKVIQPQIFAIMAVRYGGTETMTRSPRVTDKIANGQCLFVRRLTYEKLGGHALVRSHVGDDMMMAQRFFAAGKTVVGVLGIGQLSTRMYRSLSELIDGWGKNVFAAGIDSVPLGRIGKFMFPFFLPLSPLVGVLPAAILLLGLVAPLPTDLTLWAGLSQVSLLVWWFYVYRLIDESPFYALLSPLGAAMTSYIFLRAVARGKRVEWKGREYVAE